MRHDVQVVKLKEVNFYHGPDWLLSYGIEWTLAKSREFATNFKVGCGLSFLSGLRLVVSVDAADSLSSSSFQSLRSLVRTGSARAPYSRSQLPRTTRGDAYYPATFFIDTHWDRLQGIEFGYQIKLGDQAQIFKISKAQQEMEPSRKRYKRRIFWFDVRERYRLMQRRAMRRWHD